MMVPPRLNLRLALEQGDYMPDGLGGYRIVWRRLGWLWGALGTGAGRERRGQVDLASVASWKITLRSARPGDPRRPKPGQRLRHQQRLFLIESVAEHDRDGRWLTCFAREEVQR